MRRAGCAGFWPGQGRPVLQSPVGVLLRGQQQPGQVLAPEYIEDKAGEHERGYDRRDVEYTAQALPSGSLGIEKYLFIEHRRFLRYTVRIVWKLNPRVN